MSNSIFTELFYQTRHLRIKFQEIRSVPGTSATPARRLGFATPTANLRQRDGSSSCIQLTQVGWLYKVIHSNSGMIIMIIRTQEDGCLVLGSGLKQGLLASFDTRARFIGARDTQALVFSTLCGWSRASRASVVESRASGVIMMMIRSLEQRVLLLCSNSLTLRALSLSLISLGPVHLVANAAVAAHASSYSTSDRLGERPYQCSVRLPPLLCCGPC